MDFTAAAEDHFLLQAVDATDSWKKTVKLASVWITSLVQAGCADSARMLLCAYFLCDQGRFQTAHVRSGQMKGMDAAFNRMPATEFPAS